MRQTMEKRRRKLAARALTITKEGGLEVHATAER
jgi:hypothetical protein